MLYHHPGFKHGVPGEYNDQIELQFYSFITKEEERERNKLPAESGWLTIVPLNYREYKCTYCDRPMGTVQTILQEHLKSQHQIHPEQAKVTSATSFKVVKKPGDFI